MKVRSGSGPGPDPGPGPLIIWTWTSYLGPGPPASGPGPGHLGPVRVRTQVRQVQDRPLDSLSISECLNISTPFSFHQHVKWFSASLTL